MARPTLLTSAVAERMVQRVRQGAYPEVAAQAAGVTLKTYRRWIERGRIATRGKYRDLYEAIYRAESASLVAAIAELRKHGKTEWRAELAFLDATRPERWAKDRPLPPEPVDTARANRGGVYEFGSEEELAALNKRLDAEDAADPGSAPRMRMLLPRLESDPKHVPPKRASSDTE